MESNATIIAIKMAMCVFDNKPISEMSKDELDRLDVYIERSKYKIQLEERITGRPVKDIIQ